jgi:spermidine synthase
LSDRTPHHIRLFGICELVIGLFGIISIPIIYKMPSVYLYIYRSYHLSPKLFFLTQILLCASVMLIPTSMMGATFPLVSRIITDNFSELGAKVGRAYFWNTTGAVVGSALAGFLAIPLLGIKGAAFSAALLNLLVGLMMIAISRGSLAQVIGILIVPASLGCYWSAGASQETFLLNYYSAYKNLNELPYDAIKGIEKNASHLVFSGEYPEGNVKAFRQADGSLLLQVGGKAEGTAVVDMDNTVLLAYLPLASHPDPRDFLVIGLGAGVTLDAAKGQAKQVDLVEINPGVIEAVAQNSPPGLLDGVRIIRNDARNYLTYADKKYDVISSEPSYPSESSVAGLFTQDFYRVAAQRLKKNGVYCQWLPYYILSNDEITMMLKTFSSVFPHSYLWKVTKSLDLILVGSLDPFVPSTDEIIQRVAGMRGKGAPLGYTLSRTPEQLREIAARKELPVNTDDQPLLEFATINNFIIGDLSLKDKK